MTDIGLSASDRALVQRYLNVSPRSSRGLVPVGNGAAMPTANYTASQKTRSLAVIYLPQGTLLLRLAFATMFVSGNVESDLVDPFQANISYAVRPAPWKAGKAYALGDKATCYPTFATGSSGNPYWVAANANTNSRPGPNKADWAPGTAPTPLAVTVGGQLVASAVASTRIDGVTVVTPGILEFDTFGPVGATAECFIEIKSYILQSASGLKIAAHYAQPYIAGSFLESGTGLTDITMSTTSFVTASNYGGTVVRPVLASGIPALNDGKRGIAVIGDSEPTGMQGGSGVATVSVNTNGTGWTTANIGEIISVGVAGASTYAVNYPAKIIVVNVAAGVPSFRVIDQGSYSGTGVGAGSQTMPDALQAANGTGVTGCVVSLTYSSTCLDPGDDLLAQGFLQRALSSAGRRYSLFVSPGDGICNWDTRDYSRLALLERCGATEAHVQLGINDITGGKTYAQMKAAADKFNAQLYGMGYEKIAYYTVPPAPYSSTGAMDLGGQNVQAYDAVRQQWNAAIRAGSIGNAFIDTAAVLEDGGASAPSGKFIANGTPCYITADMKHWAPAGRALLAAAVVAGLPA